MRQKFLWLAVLCSFLFTSCLPGGNQASKGGHTITVYGFSIMKESLEKDIYPAFAAKWKAEHGENVHFVSSFAGSKTVVNQILQGAPAEFEF
jgi:ABC-type sulfate transport system substrate-binding protein